MWKKPEKMPSEKPTKWRERLRKQLRRKQHAYVCSLPLTEGQPLNDLITSLEEIRNSYASPDNLVVESRTDYGYGCNGCSGSTVWIVELVTDEPLEVVDRRIDAMIAADKEDKKKKLDKDKKEYERLKKKFEKGGK